MKQDINRVISSVNLGLLFHKGSLFNDEDCDGYPEQVNLFLVVTPGLQSGDLWAGLVNLAARLNIESCGSKMPIPATVNAPAHGMLLVKSPSDKFRSAACLESNKQGGWSLFGHSASAMKRVLNALATGPILPQKSEILRIEIGDPSDPFAQAHTQNGIIAQVGLPAEELIPTSEPPDRKVSSDLSSLSQTFLSAVANDPRTTRCMLGIVLPKKLSSLCGRALFSLISTATSQATELQLPLARVGSNSHSGLCLTIEETQDKEAWLRYSHGKLVATGGTNPLAKLINELERLWFESDAPGGEPLEKWKEGLYKAALLTEGKGSTGRVLHALAKGRNLPQQERQDWGRAASACRVLDLPLPELKARRAVICRTMKMVGEEKRLLSQALMIPYGQGEVFCRAYLSASHRARTIFEEKLKSLLLEKGYDPKVVVLRTHKPAVSWLLDEVEPVLPMDARSLRISFRPFSMSNQMESKARWVHEIYPAPDILCQRRGWQVDKVQMVMDNEQEQAYVVQAFNSGGNPVMEFHLTPPFSCLGYSLELRSDQTIYPTTAGLQLEQNRKECWSCQVSTDRELFWRRLQEKWMPEIIRSMKDALPGLLKRKALAFWDEIRFEVAIDEGQDELEFAEERIAPMEALHEDLYFGLLAFMQAFRERYCPESNIQLGRVVPLVRPAYGKQPSAKLRLQPYKYPVPTRQSNSDITCIGYGEGNLLVELSCDQQPLQLTERERLCKAAKAWGFNLTPTIEGVLFKARPAKQYHKAGSGEGLSMPDAANIPSGEEIRSWTQTLSGLSGFSVWRAGKSIMGQDILAVEATLGGGMSANRARLLKPTLLVNARHHANEVSGSNAAVCLLHEIASGGKAAEMLVNANVVVVPLENADGVTTLEEMLPEAPDHKLHAARYNALGMEWYDQYFVPDTPFSEARVKARLFERWLPEYLVDLHGVPSHEWEQPFAGYINPNFKEHWIPRSFVYAILPFYDQTDHPGSVEARQLAAEMSAAMEKEHDIVQLNQEIYNRYERYAKAFEPEVFNSKLERSLVVVPTCERMSKTNYGNQKWPLVKSEIITEVLDEVARGPWLEKCTRAHLVIIKTMLARMCRSKKAHLVRQEQPNGVLFSWRR